MVKSLKRKRNKGKKAKKSQITKSRIYKKSRRRTHKHSLKRANRKLRTRSRSKSRKIKGGGNLSYHDFIPQDLVNGFRSVGDGASNLYHNFIGKPHLPSSMPVNQPLAVNNNAPIPERTNLRVANSAAVLAVNSIN